MSQINQCLLRECKNAVKNQGHEWIIQLLSLTCNMLVISAYIFIQHKHAEIL